MSLRNLPDLLPEVVAAIDARLTAICSTEHVAIPLAIESGSRAWGFPSPDSDYDCRFVFVRPVEQHLSPWPRRDVIEDPPIGDLDLNGWEFGKAIRLLLKGNAVIIEWLRSPLVYRGEAWFRNDFLAFAERFADRNLIGRHYLHLGERQRRTYFADRMNIPQKKIFYALRPAATLRWLRLHADAVIAPMHFPTLLRECAPPVDVAMLTVDLMRRKALTRELGTEPLPEPIARFIDAEFMIARDLFGDRAAIVSDEARHEADRLFRNATLRL